jgi:hypothetical protein
MRCRAVSHVDKKYHFIGEESGCPLVISFMVQPRISILDDLSTQASLLTSPPPVLPCDSLPGPTCTVLGLWVGLFSRQPAVLVFFIYILRN